MIDVGTGSCGCTGGLEASAGPFAVTGEQMRRGLGAHAFHQIHSVRGEKVELRRLRPCVVCARHVVGAHASHALVHAAR